MITSSLVGVKGGHTSCVRRSSPYVNLLSETSRQAYSVSYCTCLVQLCKRKCTSQVVHGNTMPRETIVQQPKSGGESTESNGLHAANPSGREDVQQESMVLLEWPTLCRQVAAFASTPLAARRIMMSGLPIGRSQVLTLNTSLQSHNE
jgi:hypothetical protein